MANSKFPDIIIKYNGNVSQKKKQRKCKPREGESQSHPDSSRVEKGEVDLEGDPAGGEAAGEEHGRPQLVGEHRRDAAAEVPRGAL
jgi:hypothetical protein